MAYDGENLKVVGTRPIRPDGVEKVIGRANFGADMVMPGMLWGKVLRSLHAHARIKSIKTDKALKLPGVKADVTAADFPEIASNDPPKVANPISCTEGNAGAGFTDAEIIIERKYTSQPVHQAYIEPHACVVSAGTDGQCTVWSSSQGQFMVRAYCAKLLGLDIASIRAMPAEIGGGFGGKTLVYLEPVALALSKKTGRPVKIVMSREEVFRGTG